MIMDKKYIIIILIIAVIAVIAGYFLFNNTVSEITTEQSTIVLSKSAYMEVPKNSNATSKADKKGIFYYKDNKEDINVTSCSNLSASSSVKEMKKLKNDIATGSKKLNENNHVIYEKNGTYSVFVKNTKYNDTLLIQSTDKNLLIQCLNSVNYHDPTTKIKFNDTTSSGSGNVINAVEQTESAVESSYSSGSSSADSSASYSTSSYSDNSYDSSSSSSGSGSGGYSDFGFSGSSSSSTPSQSSGSSGGGYSDFGFD
jgi:hypothetical protein